MNTGIECVRRIGYGHPLTKHIAKVIVDGGAL